MTIFCRGLQSGRSQVWLLKFTAVVGGEKKICISKMSLFVGLGFFGQTKHISLYMCVCVSVSKAGTTDCSEPPAEMLFVDELCRLSNFHDFHVCCARNSSFHNHFESAVSLKRVLFLRADWTGQRDGLFQCCQSIKVTLANDPRCCYDTG